MGSTAGNSGNYFNPVVLYIRKIIVILAETSVGQVTQSTIIGILQYVPDGYEPQNIDITMNEMALADDVGNNTFVHGRFMFQAGRPNRFKFNINRRLRSGDYIFDYLLSE